MKVAVYSGEVPSTTFIERLIKGLSSKKGIQIYVFGRQKKERPSYGSKVIIKSFHNTIGQILLGLSYRVLFLLKPNLWKRYKVARGHYSRSAKERLKDWGRVLPVVYCELDIFHIQWVKSLPDWIFLENLGVSVICSLRGAHINYSPLADDKLAKTYRELFPKCSGFHAVSKAIMDEASRYSPIQGKTEVIYSGLNLEEFPLNIRPEMTNSLKVISIGRPHWKKGYHYALDAFKHLKERKFNFSYTIIGGEMEELQYQLNDLELTSCVHFQSNLSIAEVKKEICSHDLFLLPSVEEGIANVVLESMALGTLVLSTDCGGMREVIEDGVSGFIVSNRSPEEMAAKIEQIAGLSKKELLTICQNARGFIEKNHSIDQMTRKMMSLYQSVYQVS